MIQGKHLQWLIGWLIRIGTGRILLVVPSCGTKWNLYDLVLSASRSMVHNFVFNIKCHFRGVTTLSWSTGSLIRMTALRGLNGCLITTMAIFGMRRQCTMATITPGQFRTQMCVKTFGLIPPSVYHSIAGLSIVIMQANHSVSTQQMLQPARQADSNFLCALLTGSDSMSGSPLWSPSPSDSGISEDPASDQMDSPQRPESPPGDDQYFSTRPQMKAALEGRVATDRSESHDHKKNTLIIPTYLPTNCTHLLCRSATNVNKSYWMIFLYNQFTVWTIRCEQNISCKLIIAAYLFPWKMI